MELLVPIALVLAGLSLIVVEVYLVPGVNVVGLVGALTMLFGIGYAFSETGLAGGLATAAGAVALTGGVLYTMWRTGAWDQFVLAASLKRDAEAAAIESEKRSRYVGRSGVALSPLRPTGIADIDGDRIEVVTEGGFVAAGSRIKVVAMDRRHFFVRVADTTPD